jgi:hypothetical protein
MKFFPVKISRAQGYALLMVLTIVGIAALTAGATLRRTYTVASLNQRSKQFQSSMYAAEAAVEKVYARFRYDYVTGGDAAISNNLSIYRALYPTSAENAHWANYQFWDAQGNNNQTYVQRTSNKLYQVLDGSYAGLSGWRGIYRVVSNARPLTGMNQVGAGVQQEIALDTIPAFQFAIFYNGQLEFTQCAPLTVRGRTHANGPICLGAPSGAPKTLTFLGTVSTTSSIIYSNLGGYTSFSAPVYSGTPQQTVGVPTLQLPIGTNNTPAAVREIINMPPSGEPANSLMGEQRFYNKASIALLVSNTSVTMIVKDYGDITGTTTNIAYNSSSPTATQRTNLARALPFLNLTNEFRDYRESDWVMPTQIDMGVLKNWLPTNSLVLSRYPAGSGSYPNILYVGDFRTLSDLHAVRVANGTIIPTNGPSHSQATGFTIATPNPLYVWGDYNTPNLGHRGTTNTTATFPASFICDAITVLSPSWADNDSSTLTHSSRNAANTTVNAAILAGAVYSTGPNAGQWSGGVHNLTRLIEDWGGRTLTLNTSLVNLYNSIRANSQFQNPGNYYYAPNRNFNFDQNFLLAAKLPPGTPTVSVISRFKWSTAPINNVTYNAP